MTDYGPINKVLLRQSHTHSPCIADDCFWAVIHSKGKELHLTSEGKGLCPFKGYNISYLSLCRKRLLTPGFM